MMDNIAHNQGPEDARPPKPGIAPEDQKDEIDPESPDAKSLAPSEGSGLSGKVEAPPRDEPSWMQDA